MRLFTCHCGNRVFFENTACQECGRQLGFDPDRLNLVSLNASSDGHLTSPAGMAYRRCANHHRYYNCNWLLRAQSVDDLCFSCNMNELIPALDRPGNIKLWTRMEEAKRRLLYSLLSLDLPLTGEHRMAFRFLEDHRRNPDVFEAFVTTGHMNKTITVNIAEADDAARHEAREQMHELYRTVLGHMRHESAHFYFSFLTGQDADLQECRELFGDERSDYSAALNMHYQNGPPFDWPQRFISAYASAHPAEDFAETFAHFLHITDALESARAGKLLEEAGLEISDNWVDTWIQFSVTLNEVNRSLGGDDAYPFLISEPVREKLDFIDRLVRQQAAQQQGV